ncbi:MAG: transporter substrate-binding domain-containing protein, partial [Alphaproteobacteria bacterium]|nr:transporter substrate-binding domain-containing protein [Alphaproteobacteria bacterium]
VTAWKKGPLIDPAAPYAPENAQLLFAVGACVALNVYVLVLAAWRRRARPAWYVPWLAMVLAFFAAEGTLQAYLAINQVTYFRPHPVLHWVVRPNLDHFDNLTGGGVITTNADGMREVDVPRAKGPDEYRILALGDSSNFGHGVEGDEMWEAVLEDLLDPLVPGKTVHVLNGAVPGWTTYQALEMLELYGLDYQPDLVIAGFNNDPGPEYLGDAKRAVSPGARRALASVLWRSELFLLGREAVLAFARRLHPDGQYDARKAGENPHYGKLSEDESAKLTARIQPQEFLDNLTRLEERGQEAGYDFVWINMPVNRQEPEFVERYVDWSYRDAAEALSIEKGFPIIDVDDYWVRTREQGLHIVGHVFHPNAEGHARMAQQIAEELIARGLVPGASGDVTIEGPPPAATAETLRLGWSSLTPVHAHVGAVLEDHPELAARFGLVVEQSAYASGKTQGKDLAEGKLDAWFTCEVPAVHMMRDRPDARIIGSPGVLGRIAVVARAEVGGTLADLAGKKVGLAEGSTPAMDWQRWGQGVGATTVNLPTDGLYEALRAGEVDAVVSWDPWVEDWLQRDPGALVVLAERPFYSELAVDVPWALEETFHQDSPPEGGWRAERLNALIAEALALAAADRERYDARVAELSGWPVEVVRAVADRNAALSGGPVDLSMTPEVTRSLRDASQYVTRGGFPVDRMLGLSLIEGDPPPRGEGPGGGPPPGDGPPKPGGDKPAGVPAGEPPRPRAKLPQGPANPPPRGPASPPPRVDGPAEPQR